MHIKSGLLLCTLVSVMLAASSCGKVAPLYEGKLNGTRIVFFTKDNLKSLVFAHADETKILQIGELQFGSVRGYGRGFGEVAGSQMLIFVTKEPHGVFIHAFDLQNKIDVKAPIGDASGFGYDLGRSNQQSEAITLLTSNKLLLSITDRDYSSGKMVRMEYIFDLQEKNVRFRGKTSF